MASHCEKPTRSAQEIEKEYEDVKNCVISKLETIAESHVRDLQGLKDIIDAQTKRIQTLEMENELKTATIQNLEQKLEEVSSQQSDGSGNDGNSQSDLTLREAERMFKESPKTGKSISAALNFITLHCKLKLLIYYINTLKMIFRKLK